MPSVSPEDIAECVLDTFDSLPAKCKPRSLDNGRREWVPLAGLVLSRGYVDDLPPQLTCAALATGMKCLPQSKLALAKGNVLHDWHAEILALRGFNRWVIDECEALAQQGKAGLGTWVRWREGGRPPFELHPDVRIHMYCSEAPCGDASMELIMAAQDDASAWTSTVPEDAMLGRGHFDRLGVVRRKPARPDAPMTGSKSCSDKLALRQCTGILSGLASLLVHPERCYLETLVVPETQYVSAAVNRAFGITGRMAPVGIEEAQSRWQRDGFAFRPFDVRTTKREFTFSKRSGVGATAVPSNLSALYTPHRQEILINGVRQGRRQLDPLGASCVSRRMLWKSVLDIAMLAGMPALAATLQKQTYAEVKQDDLMKAREAVKRTAKELALQGWRGNDGDEDWGLESP